MAALVRYVCSLPNPGASGAPHELFYPDTPDGLLRAAMFAATENGSGRGIYDCIGRLRAGATVRNKDTVAELDQIVVDLDVKNITEPREEVFGCLTGLILPPTEIRDSGHGLHAVWQLKEPVTDGDLDLAESIMARLVELLAADPAPTHRAALLRRPGTSNTKDGTFRKCEVIGGSKIVVDIGEFADLFDLYGDRALLTRKLKSAGNGHAKGEARFRNVEGKLDVDAALAALEPNGASVNDIQPRVILSLLQKAEHPNDVIEYVVDATMKAAAGVGWTHEAEVREVTKRVKSELELLQREYDPSTGTVPPWLHAEFHEEWAGALAQGLRPRLRRTGFGCGWCVQGYGAPQAAPSAPSAGRAPERPSEPKPKRGGPFVLRPFTPFDLITLPPRQWLYDRHYQRRTVGGTVAPGGFGKTTLCMVETVIMATARNLLGEQPEERLRVWYHNGEDSLEELNRRIGAICLHYDIDQEELSKWLFLTSGNEVPLRVAKGYNSLEIDARLIRQITEAVGDNRIDVATLDPLVTLHGVPEGDNSKMNTVIGIFAGIADTCNCSFELAHHTRKQPAGTAGYDYIMDDLRGASATGDAMRAIRTLNHMSQADADAAGIPATERTSYFRVDRVKANNAPPARVATWRHFVNVSLPNGDEVGVVTPWDYPGQGAQSPAKTAAEAKAEQMFLHLLDRAEAEHANVSPRPGPNYAPTRFAQMPEARAAGVSKAALAGAMQRLLDAKRVAAQLYGRDDRQSARLVIVKEQPQDE